jgi:Tol biopolymer transport system component
MHAVPLPQPGTPTWSPDGTRIALASVAPLTRRFREGTNQVLTISAVAAGDDRWFAPVPMLSIDSRGGCGPVWSPDGTKMAAIYEGVLSVWHRQGEPLGPPRRVTSEAPTAELVGRLAGTSSISRWTSCGSSTSRTVQLQGPCRSI